MNERPLEVLTKTIEKLVIYTFWTKLSKIWILFLKYDISHFGRRLFYRNDLDFITICLRQTAPSTVVMIKKSQQICQTGQNWDEELPEDPQEIVEDWTTIRTIVIELQTPRYYNLRTAQAIELHVFQAPRYVI